MKIFATFHEFRKMCYIFIEGWWNLVTLLLVVLFSLNQVPNFCTGNLINLADLFRFKKKTFLIRF